MQSKKHNKNESVSKERVSKPSPKEPESLTQQSPDSTAIQRARLGDPSLTPSDVTALQGTIGNRAIGRLLKRSLPTVQPKLTVNAPGDQFEQEADRVAEEVLNMPVADEAVAFGDQEPSGPPTANNIQAKPLADSITPLVQRREVKEASPSQAQLSRTIQRARNSDVEETPVQTKPAAVIQRAKNSEKEETPLQAKPAAAGQALEASDDLEDRLNSTKGGGSALPDTVRDFMEPRFGSDFSGVRVHTGSNSVQMNRDFQARAFTHGKNIYYGPGQAPSNDSLTAHELTHVVQQTGVVQRKGGIKPPSPALLGGITPTSQVLKHLESERSTLNGTDASLYRKKIDDFKRSHSNEQIMEKQDRLLPKNGMEIKQKGDRSQIFRACGDSEAAGKITHQTKFAAPDGSANTRKKIGVGEEVKFTAPKEGKWKASKGTPASADSVKEFNWTAPDRASSPRITFEADGKTSSVGMSVLEPQRITATKINDMPYTAGRQGAGMKLRFNYFPMTVSFGNVEVKEVSHAASGISGYYGRHGMPHWHDTGDTFYPIRADNKDSAVDTAATSGYPSPWSKGSFHWNIPNKFKTKTESGDGKRFTTVTQAFSMADSTGKTKVTKGGEEVERTP